MVVYFDESIINNYIILQTEIKTMIIFRKKTNEEILAGKNENEEGKKGDSKGKKNSFME